MPAWLKLPSPSSGDQTLLRQLFPWPITIIRKLPYYFIFQSVIFIHYLEYPKSIISTLVIYNSVMFTECGRRMKFIYILHAGCINITRKLVRNANSWVPTQPPESDVLSPMILCFSKLPRWFWHTPKVEKLWVCFCASVHLFCLKIKRKIHFFPLAYFVVRIQYIIYTTCKTCDTQLFMWLVRVPVNRKLLVRFLGSQTLYEDFQLCKGSVPQPHIFQGSTVILYVNYEKM